MCPAILQDQSLLAKLSAGDLIALEAKYHAQCLVSLYNKARQTKISKEQIYGSAINQGIALAELVTFIEDAKQTVRVHQYLRANIASSGTADSYLKVSHVTRTRHAHQVTASSL